MKITTKCPTCKRKLSLKQERDVIVDKEIGAVYCAYCQSFIDYIEAFITTERGK